MSEIITTLHKKDDATVDVYPNIKPDNIPSGAVTTAKINDGAVTSDKIADGAVTNNKIGTGAITYSKIADSAISANKIVDNAISISKMGFRLYEHIYNCHCSSPSTNFVIKFLSTHIPFTSTLDLFEYLYNTYGLYAPVAINKKGNLTDILGYVNGLHVIEFTDENLETYDCDCYDTSMTSYSHQIF